MSGVVSSRRRGEERAVPGRWSPTLAEAFDPRHNSLNALRLVFAIAVIVSHAWPLGGFGADPRIGDLSVGTWAVGGFFVISGYLIAASRRTTGLTSFFGRRFLRIFPGLWVCLLAIVVVFVPIAAIREPGTFPPSPGHVLSFLGRNAVLLSHNYGIDGTLVTVPYSPGSWDGSIWTLFYEVSWYVVIGGLFTVSFFRRSGWAVTGAFAAVVAAHIIDAETGFTGGGRASLLVDLGAYFLAGAVLEAWAAVIPMRSLIAAGAAAVLTVSALLDQATLLAALPLAYLCLWLGIALPFQRVGRKNDISYGVYIYAFPVQQLLVLYGVAGLGIATYLGLSILVTLPLAVLSWMLVERPAMRQKSRFGPASERALLPPLDRPAVDEQSTARPLRSAGPPS